MKKISILFILSYVFFTSCSTKNKDKVASPNFIVIMADDLGYGDLSCYGNTSINTPNIDELASNGIKFIDFHSNGAVCSPTRAALMTGKYQQRTGINGVVTAKSHRHVGLNLNEITIAEELKKHGYNTAMFGKWHLGYSKEFNPVLQGFNKYEGFVSGNVDYHGHIDQEGYLDWWKGDKIENVEGYSTDLITKNGVNFIKKNNPKKTGKPFFLYLPHESPHGPYQRRIDKVLRKVGTAGTLPVHKDSIKSIYKEMVEVMDEGIGNVIAALKETDQYKNTIVIFISDNGANRYGSNGVLRGHKGGVYEGGSRVPAIISYPQEIKNGRISNETVLTMDLLPTLLDFIDKTPSAANIDGISIKDHLLHNTSIKKRDVFYAYKNRSFIRSGKWKMIETKKNNQQKFELYDLLNDLSETKNLSTDYPNLIDSLSNKLASWKKNTYSNVRIVSN